MDDILSNLFSSLSIYLSSLETFFLTHFGPSSPPFLSQLEALPSTFLESSKKVLTGDPTTFFVYITLPILMFSAFRGRGKELDKQEAEGKKEAAAALADAETLASIKRASDEQVEVDRPFVSTKGKDGKGAGRGNAPVKRNTKKN